MGKKEYPLLERVHSKSRREEKEDPLREGESGFLTDIGHVAAWTCLFNKSLDYGERENIRSVFW